MVIAPEHPQLQNLTTAQNKSEVQAYVKAAASKSDLERTELQKEKSGVFTGILDYRKTTRGNKLFLVPNFPQNQLSKLRRACFGQICINYEQHFPAAYNVVHPGCKDLQEKAQDHSEASLPRRCWWHSGLQPNL